MYEVDVQQEPVPYADADETSVFLETFGKSEHREEILVYDGNTIVSAMGGSLSLFLVNRSLSLLARMKISFFFQFPGVFFPEIRDVPGQEGFRNVRFGLSSR